MNLFANYGKLSEEEMVIIIMKVLKRTSEILLFNITVSRHINIGCHYNEKLKKIKPV